MNSGITSVEEDEEYYYFKGESGSVYKCWKDSEKIRMNNGGVANEIEKSGLGKVVKYNDIKDKLKQQT